MQTKTLAQWAQTAIDVQDACNMGGVARSFAELVIFLHSIRGANGTDWVNQHPLVKLFADKMADLSRVRDYVEFSRAYDEAQRLASGADERRANVA